MGNTYETIDKQIASIHKMMCDCVMVAYWPQALLDENGDLIKLTLEWKNPEAEETYNKMRDVLDHLIEVNRKAKREGITKGILERAKRLDW